MGKAVFRIWPLSKIGIVDKEVLFNMTFSSATKNEISKIAVTNKCCQLALLSALIKMNGTLQIQGIDRIGIILSTENASIARMMFSLLKSCFKINTKVVVRRNRHLKKNNNYALYIDSAMGLMRYSR